MSLCGKHLISLDTLNKVVVNNFPNVFNLQSVNTDQQASLTDVCLFEDRFATISQDPDQPQCKLVVAGVKDGQTSFECSLPHDDQASTSTISGISYAKTTGNLVYIVSSADGTQQTVKTLGVGHNQAEEAKQNELTDEILKEKEFSSLYIAKNMCDKQDYIL